MIWAPPLTQLRTAPEGCLGVATRLMRPWRPVLRRLVADFLSFGRTYPMAARRSWKKRRNCSRPWLVSKGSSEGEPAFGEFADGLDGRFAVEARGAGVALLRSG